MFQVLDRKKNNKISGGAFDSNIAEGIKDEEASQDQQSKIQEARKRKDWSTVRKLSQDWRNISGYRKK